MAHFKNQKKTRKNKMAIKFSKEVSEFIESNGSRSEDYYWFPHYYKKVGDGLFEMVDFKDLPTELSRIVEQQLPRSEEDFK